MSGPPDDITIADDALVVRRISEDQQFFDEKGRIPPAGVNGFPAERP